jgi:hypothetical protein
MMVALDRNYAGMVVRRDASQDRSARRKKTAAQVG